MENSFRLDLFSLILLAQRETTDYKDMNPVLIEQSCETVSTKLNSIFIGVMN